ncbi:hypothetical protein Fmac_024493 [Flemingia macrophylla]|uniref:Kinesin motor domain-containing protein n=1 Tax=Flemingia macrophylla TaxID=520843 RepID=A0ABD1LPJ1_9FABA
MGDNIANEDEVVSENMPVPNGDEQNVLLPSEDASEVSKSDSGDGSPPVSTDYTDVGVVPEHQRNELDHLISNLEREIKELRVKQKNLDIKRREALSKILDIKESVFVEVEPILRSAMDGHNVCVFAYGQTSTGKTFTMDGTNEQPGIIPRALEELFRQASLDNSSSFTFSMSMLEVYMGNLRDLLAPRPSSKLHESTTKCLTRIIIYRGGDALEAKSEISKLWMIDLGGSERLLKTGARGLTLDEGRAINLSLSALADVVAALKRKRGHVPYRQDVKKQREKKIMELEEDIKEAEKQRQILREQIQKIELKLSESKKLLSTAYSVAECDDITTSISPKDDVKEVIETPKSSKKPIKRNFSNSVPRFMTSTVASRQRQSAAERDIGVRLKSLRSMVSKSAIHFSYSQSSSYSDIRIKAILRSSIGKSRHAETDSVPIQIPSTGLTEKPKCNDLESKVTTRSKMVTSSDPNLRVSLCRHRRRMSDLI